MSDARGDVVTEGRSDVGRDHATLPPESIDIRRVTWSRQGDRIVVRTRLADVLAPHAERGYQSVQRVLSILDIDGARVVRIETDVMRRGSTVTSFNYPAECEGTGGRVDYERDVIVQWVPTDCLTGPPTADVVSRARLQVEHLLSARGYRAWIDDVPVRRFRTVA